MTSTAQNLPQLTPGSIRSAWRDTFIYSSDDRDTVLGGLLASEGISNGSLYSMVEIICIFTNTFHIQDDREQLVENDARALKPGNYYISTKGSITVTSEAPLFHQILMQTATHVGAFTHAVRNRDQRCVITGRPAVVSGVTFWEAFEAAHVFPLKHAGYWKTHNFGRWINIPPASASHGTINSVQNGILLTRDMHALFDSYQISINPKEQHMIVCFTPFACSYGIAGAHLDQRFLENPLRPTDPLLFWHFRQAVLANMKGAGETCFEMGFPPSPGTAGQIMGGKKAAEGMDLGALGTLDEQGIRA